MKEAYFPQEIEKRWQEIWEKGNVFHTPDDSENLNIMLYQCFHIRQANCIWDM